MPVIDYYSKQGKVADVSDIRMEGISLAVEHFVSD